MIIILSLILLLEAFLFFACFNRRLTSVSLWSSGMFLVSSVAYIFNLNYFGKDISGVTAAAIGLCPIFYSFGELLAQRVSIKAGRRRIRTIESKNNQFSQYAPTTLFTWICTILILFIVLYKFIDMYRFASSKGLQSVILLVSYMRPYMVNGEYENSTVISLTTSAAEAVAYIYLFILIHYEITNKKIKVTLSLPVIAYILLLILSTGRTGFIKVIIVILGMTYVVLRKTNKYQFKTLFKFVKYVLTGVFILIAVFYIYGKVARGSQRTLLEYFANYFSAGIYGLNDYFTHPWPNNSHFGEYILSNFYYYVNEILGTSYVIPSHNLPFFRWAVSQSNIYTALVFPIQDFGFVGMLLSRSLIGFIYSSIEKYVLKDNASDNSLIMVIVFGLLLYCNFSIPIADRYVEFLTVTTFPCFLLFLFVFNKLVLRSSRRRKIRFSIHPST